MTDNDDGSKELESPNLEDGEQSARPVKRSRLFKSSESRLPREKVEDYKALAVALAFDPEKCPDLWPILRNSALMSSSAPANRRTCGSVDLMPEYSVEGVCVKYACDIAKPIVPVSYVSDCSDESLSSDGSDSSDEWVYPLDNTSGWLQREPAGNCNSM